MDNDNAPTVRMLLPKKTQFTAVSWVFPRDLAAAGRTLFHCSRSVAGTEHASGCAIVFIEAIDKLRCVRAHEDSWLVAKFVEMRDRDFWEGELGCPVCEARYPVKEGIVYFSRLRPQFDSGARIAESSDESFALAAMLDLSAPDRTVVLCDGWTGFAAGLRDISQPHVFVVNGIGGEAKTPSECIYEVVSKDSIPLAPASVDAVALDVASSAELVQSAVRVLREGGRLVAKAGVEVPAEVLLLASDDEKWVAQKRADFIPLRRANR